jgi:hypothetical protein
MIDFHSVPSRILEIASDDPELDPARPLRAFRLLLLAYLTTELTISFLTWSSVRPPVVDPLLLATGASLAMILALIPRVAQYAAPLATFLLAYALVRSFPNVANQTFLLFLGLATVSSFDLRDSEERLACFHSLRWLLAIVLFSMGIQKCLHGTYFQGQFLEFQVAHSDHFASVFRFCLAPQEYQSLRALGEGSSAGSGPYRFTGVVPLFISNAVWLLPLLAPAFLLWRRTRGWVTVLVIAFVLAVELGAHNAMFGVLLASSMLLFFRNNWMGRFLPFICAVYAYFIGVRAGWFPERFLH